MTVLYCPCSAEVIDGEHQGPCGISAPEQDQNVCPSCDLGLPYGCTCPPPAHGRSSFIPGELVAARRAIEALSPLTDVGSSPSEGRR